MSQTGAASSPSLSLDILILGLSITSSWGNGQATTWRGLVRELAALGHRVHFVERDQPELAAHRDALTVPGCTVSHYDSLQTLRDGFTAAVRDADVVVVGSSVPQGVAVVQWVLSEARGVTAFYDIEAPVTMARLLAHDEDSVHPQQLPRFDLVFSAAGGPHLVALERDWGVRQACALYHAVDPAAGYAPRPGAAAHSWDLGFLGAWRAERQLRLESLLNDAARLLPECRFAVAGAQYPPDLAWPPNVTWLGHLQPCDHAAFYTAQRFALDLVHGPVLAAGHAPSVRLFEAAACGVPVITEAWPGLETLLVPGEEILIARSTSDVVRFLRDMPEKERLTIGERARQRVLGAHTTAHRARAMLEPILERVALRQVALQAAPGAAAWRTPL